MAWWMTHIFKWLAQGHIYRVDESSQRTWSVLRTVSAAASVRKRRRPLGTHVRARWRRSGSRMVASPAPKASSSDSITTASPTPDSKLSAFVRIAKPKKTGNGLQDDQNLALYNTTVSLLNEIVRDQTRVMPEWNKIQERKRKQASCSGAAFGGQTFSKQYGTLPKLVEDEPEWVVLYLSSVSDLSPKELVAAANQDNEALEKFLALDTQLLPALRLPPQLMHKNVLWALFASLSEQYGSRLSSFKQKKCITKAGIVDWAHVVYQVQFSGNNLSKVSHVASGLDVDVSGLGLTRSSVTLSTPWSGLHAELLRPPLASTRLASIFPKRPARTLTRTPTSCLC